MNLNRKSICVALAISTAVMGGCSSHTMALKYEQSSLLASSTASRKAQVGIVVDNRGTADNWLGAIRGGYGNPLKKLYTEGSTATVVRKAFEDALGARGFLGTSENSDLRIDVSLTKFDASYYFNKEAHAHFTMSLIHKPSSNVLFSREYRTDNKKGGAGAGIFGDVNALASFANETLNQTIDKALNDPDFLAALNTRITAGAETPETRLQKLEALKEKNLITEDEYQAKRKELLDRL